jgi:hypothetical protein
MFMPATTDPLSQDSRLDLPATINASEETVQLVQIVRHVSLTQLEALHEAAPAVDLDGDHARNH